MGQTIVQVDAFAEAAFSGNPAGVCLLSELRDATWMQNVASEMNVSETAFLCRQDDGYALRWFTPANEVDLCGHATLASAHVLFEEGHLSADQTARFHTASGLLTAKAVGRWIELDFPAEPAIEHPTSGLADSLGVTAHWEGRNRMDLLVQVESEKQVLEATPDFGRVGQFDARGVILTAASDRADIDFVSRFFAPQCGIDEDPVTGSAHCCLAPFWSERLGRNSLVGFQASARGGTVHTEVSGERVLLRGQAITTLRGELTC